MKEERVFQFGKYKGQPIKKVILKHMGYVIWCLDNVDGFKLTDEEQAVYDALAIANVKYSVKMVFPDERMLAHVKNKDAFDRGETPFVVCGDGMIQIDMKEKSPVVDSIVHLFDIKPVKKAPYNFLPELSHVANKMIMDYDPTGDILIYDFH